MTIALTTIVFIEQVTNHSGIKWLKQHLGEKYKLHVMYFDDTEAMHIDASVVVPKPGIVLLNPDKKTPQQEIFEKAGWKVIKAFKFDSWRLKGVLTYNPL